MRTTKIARGRNSTQFSPSSIHQDHHHNFPSFTQPPPLQIPNGKECGKKLKNLSICARNFSLPGMSRGSSKMGIQSVYELCKKTLTPSGIASFSSQVVQNLCSLLDTLTPADVGLKEENVGDDRGYGLSSLNPFNRIARWAQPITYVDVVQDNSFTMCIFCFPTSSVIPLHDHPSMTVFSKILYGSLHVKAYDWVEPPRITTVKGPTSFQVRLAKLSLDKLLTPSTGTAVLFPKSGGNLHCFTAVTPCAVLDVLTPPYEERLGRKCTYYHDYPYSSVSKGQPLPGDGKEEDYAWLAEINTPDDLSMVTGFYSGPVIQL